MSAIIATDVPALGGLRSQALEAILDAIGNRTIALGTKKSENELAQLLNISRTPVREALAILSRDGIVTQIPQRGVWVRTISPEEAEEAMWLRYDVEARAVETLAASGTTPADAERIEEELAKASSADEFLKLEIGYHASLAEQAGLATGARAIRTWGNVLRVFFSGVDLMPEQRSQMVSDDIAIGTALGEGLAEAKIALRQAFEHVISNIRDAERAPASVA